MCIKVELKIRFNVHIQSKLFVVGASSDLGQPFRPVLAVCDVSKNPALSR